jgi:hypothetical protein
VYGRSWYLACSLAEDSGRVRAISTRYSIADVDVRGRESPDAGIETYQERGIMFTSDWRQKCSQRLYKLTAAGD